MKNLSLLAAAFFLSFSAQAQYVSEPAGCRENVIAAAKLLWDPINIKSIDAQLTGGGNKAGVFFLFYQVTLTVLPSDDGRPRPPFQERYDAMANPQNLCLDPIITQD